MYIPEFKKYYQETVVPALTKSRNYSNCHQVPSLLKIVINTGLDASLDKSAIDESVKEVTKISGQKPIITKARKSISNFKLREGMPIGIKVTLRGTNMYEFFRRFVSIALPGIRDFRGLSSKLDGNGNYTIGIIDHTIFPEITIDSRKRIMGMDISIVTSAGNDEEGKELLQLMGIPFRKA